MVHKLYLHIAVFLKKKSIEIGGSEEYFESDSVYQVIRESQKPRVGRVLNISYDIPTNCPPAVFYLKLPSLICLNITFSIAAASVSRTGPSFQ